MPLIRWLVLATALGGCTGPTGTWTPPTPEPPAGLVINEVVAANDAGITDPADPTCPEHDDWIEIVNDSDAPVELEGVALSDGGDPYVFPPGSLAPGAHRLVWADGQPEQGPDHAPFRVSAAGETLQLSREGVVLDRVVVPPVPRDHSWARIRDGSSTWAPQPFPSPGAPNHRVLPDDPCFADDGGFEDHAYPCIPDEAGYLALAGDRSRLAIVKFDIFSFSTDPRMAYVDTLFYDLHDQYYLYTVFNGQPFPDLDDHPPYDGEFHTWGQLDAWARTVDLDTLVDPQQARFAGERLYSPYFYAAINGPDRAVGVGTVVHRPATAEREAFWGFELEYADDIAYGDLVVYFETLAATGPPAFADIRWLVRSPAQEALAVRMETEGLPYADRVVRYAELGQPGDVEVYNPGITAGLVKRVRAGDSLDGARDTDILVLDAIPDVLPPCAALITSVPQTPLSHVSLLARSRGIPNVYVAGITDDPEWDAWSRLPTRVAVEASDEGFRAGVLPFDDYLRWRALQTAVIPSIEPVDSGALPVGMALADADTMLELRPVVGGKAAGMRQLLTVEGLDTPDLPYALTVRPYHDHLDAHFAWIEPLLQQSPFTVPNAVRERFLVLEGRAAYDQRFPSGADQTVADTFTAMHGSSTLVGGLVRRDGLRGAIATTPMTPALRADVTSAVATAFTSLPEGTGLRFRSSSTVEDVEGFNGAGLYTSATGYRVPVDGQRSYEEAVLRVWASYWGAEAYEEREAAGLAHLDGGMGVLVHPRFDDAYELSNAVATLTRHPDGTHELLVNAQEGATSVANPPNTCPPVLPETARVRDASGALVVERLTESTEVPSGTTVLDDAQLTALFTSSVAVLDGWLAAENAVLEPTHQRDVLVLDLEVREMASGWLGGSTERLVTKQARSLEPTAATLPIPVQEVPAPRDLLARAAEVGSLVCVGDGWRVSARHVLTDPFATPDLGHATEPFLADLSVLTLRDRPALGWLAGDERTWNHLDVASATVEAEELAFTALSGDTLAIANGSLALTVDGSSTSGTVVCTPTTLWATPDAFLLDYVD
jgi:hypothetical protein